MCPYFHRLNSPSVLMFQKSLKIRQFLGIQNRVIDSRTLDPTPLQNSDAIEDNILSILFGKPINLSSRIRAILSKMAKLKKRERRDALTQLLILSGLRKATKVVLEEAKNMPLQVDIEQDPYLVQLVNFGRLQGKAEGETIGIAKGKAEGKAEGETLALIRLTERRFGPLPSSIRDRIMSADIESIELWFDRAIDAKSIAEIFVDRTVN
ncbi:hypothetical protein CCP2SC5_510007 [Azospirillaceae bacterium]